MIRLLMSALFFVSACEAPDAPPSWSDDLREVQDHDTWRCGPPPCRIESVTITQLADGEWVKLVCCNPFENRLPPLAPKE
jgi:hypothetical protein